MASPGSTRLKTLFGRFLPLALLIFLTGGPTAVAQFSGSSWFEQVFQPRQPPQAQPRYHRVVPKYKAARPKPAQMQTTASEKPAVPPSYFVTVLGDNLGQSLGQGLTEAFADRPEVAITLKSRESSGLVRDDFFDWPKMVRDLLASGEKIDMAVMLIGSNDHQPLRVGNIPYEAGSPKWVEIYTARIAEISHAFHDKNIPLVWLGLPVVKSDRLSAEFLTFNGYYREQAEKAGATYVDIWEAFEDDHGQYDPFGPDVNGQTVRIRTADGVSFTKAGARKLAHFVEAEIRRNLDATHPQVDPAVVTVPAETPAESAALPAVQPTAAAPATVVPVPPVKPIAGPVLPLTGPVSTPGAQLATRVKVRAMDADQALTQGVPVDEKSSGSKPERADNFAWPRP